MALGKKNNVEVVASTSDAASVSTTRVGAEPVATLRRQAGATAEVAQRYTAEVPWELIPAEVLQFYSRALANF